jgi:hypothetical protein
VPLGAKGEEPSLTSWDDRLNEHALWTKVAEFQTALGELELADDEADARETRAYMENVAALVVGRRPTPCN